MENASSPSHEGKEGLTGLTIDFGSTYTHLLEVQAKRKQLIIGTIREGMQLFTTILDNETPPDEDGLSEEQVCFFKENGKDIEFQDFESLYKELKKWDQFVPKRRGTTTKTNVRFSPRDREAIQALVAKSGSRSASEMFRRVVRRHWTVLKARKEGWKTGVVQTSGTDWKLLRQLDLPL